MATITIDGNRHEVHLEGRNLLDVCLSLGYDVPYFCWHPAMHSVGACRQCAVKQFKDENDTKGIIVMSCMTAAADGMRISVSDPEATAFRRSVAEWLMVNHPHDCPVCDEGGECHLQDMTIMNGHVYRRCRFPKRTFRNQYLGPFVNHEMNRCIQCYRCVRFYRDHAGGRDFNVFGWHDNVYFGRHEEGVLQSEFAGNLVEVCPTGVFTDKTLKKHYTRKWDLQTAPSVCVHCGLGCNTIPGERYGTLRRVWSRYNHDVNGYFLCDRGRFGYEFVNSDKRLSQPRLRRSGSDHFDEVSVEHAREVLTEIVKEHALIGIGSPRASLEANYALRTLVGPDSFFCGLSESHLALNQEILRILSEGPVPSASLAEVGRCDAALVLGEDVSNSAPMLALSLRQTVLQEPLRTAKALHLHHYEDSALREAIQREKGPLHIAYPLQTRLDDVARPRQYGTADDIARLGYAVANLLDASSPAPDYLDDEMKRAAATIADELRAAQCPVIIAGHGTGSLEVIRAAANVAFALHKLGSGVRLFFIVPHCNSLGLTMLGGGSLEDAAERVRHDRSLATVVLESDLHRQTSEDHADWLLRSAEHLVVLDHLENPTGAYADLVLPASTYAESDGTVVNNEGRAQRYFQVFTPAGGVRESWRWIGEMIEARDGGSPWQGLDDLIAQVSQLPGLAGITDAAPGAGYRLTNQRVPRQSARFSGRTAITADQTVHEPPPPDDPDAPLSYSMEGTSLQPPAPLVPRFWAAGWNSPQALNKFQTWVGEQLRGGPSGRRLIEPSSKPIDYYGWHGPSSGRADDSILIMPLDAVFGSDELSAHAPGIAELTPQPYVVMNPADMQRLDIQNGEPVEIRLGGILLHLPAEARLELSVGVAAMIVGLPGMPGLALPQWGQIRTFAPSEAGDTDE